MSITAATTKDIALIQSIAKETWPSTYGEILSTAQIEYMLEMMYSEAAILHQIEQLEHHFFIYKENNQAIAFLSIQLNVVENVAKIHKIYALPSSQGKGIGKKMIQFAEDFSVKHQQKLLQLNVNKNNRAVSFYQKMGFEILKEENIAIGNGFWMEDFVMQKNIS